MSPASDGVGISIVVPARNESATLPAQLDALLDQPWPEPGELLVVDNESTDDTAAIVAEYATRDPRVRLERVSGVNGAAAVRNAAFTLTRADRVAMCDADDVVGPRWVAAMTTGLAAHPCVTGPLEVASLNPDWLARTRGTPAADAPMTFHDNFPLLPAGNFGIQRDAWERLGGFDASMITSEDADLSMRAWRLGIPVHFDPAAVVHYRYRTAARDLFRQGLAYGTYRPRLARRARECGATVPRFSGWRSWAVLVAWLPRLATAEGRAAWSWVAGVRLGLVRGCARARTLYL